MTVGDDERDGYYPTGCLMFSLIVIVALLAAAPFAFKFFNGELHRTMQAQSLAFWPTIVLTNSGQAMVALVVVTAGICYFLVSILSQMRDRKHS